MLARPAAVKLIRPEAFQGEPSSNGNAKARFEREAQATAALRSPHTIGIFDFGVARDGSFYYVM
jgi:serine/threonine-protein kinase